MKKAAAKQMSKWFPSVSYFRSSEMDLLALLHHISLMRSMVYAICKEQISILEKSLMIPSITSQRILVQSTLRTY